jgi:nucleotide-binding universal stress UspA family protein
MYKNILLAIDLNDETSCRKPLLSAIELARTFGARLHVLTVVREVEAILEARAATIAYEVIVSDLQNRMATLIRRANASDHFHGSPMRPDDNKLAPCVTRMLGLRIFEASPKRKPPPA